MALAITTKPAKPVLEVEEFRDHARLGDDMAEDGFIGRTIAAVTAWLAGPQGWLGRSLVEQTLTLTVPLGVYGESEPAFDSGMMGLVLPRPPIIAVESVGVVDSTGDATTVPQSGYAIAEGSDDLTRLYFTPDFRAPILAAGPAFLRVVYRAGYGPKGTDVDEGIRHALTMAVMRLYAGRGDPSVSLQTDPMIAKLFAPYRIWTAQ